MNHSVYTGGPGLGLAGGFGERGHWRGFYMQSKSMPAASLMLSQLCIVAVSHIVGRASSWTPGTGINKAVLLLRGSLSLWRKQPEQHWTRSLLLLLQREHAP